MKVLLHVPLSPFTGYGNDGIGLVQAFLRTGADVRVMPQVVQAPLPPEVAAVLTKEVEAPFDLLISHVDPTMLQLSGGLADVAKVKVGWTMWEYSNFGNLPGRSKLKKNLKHFDALVAYDDVTAGCFRDVAHKNQSVITVQGGFDPSRWPKVERDWNGRFGFCMVGALNERKDPFVAIEAFRQLKEEFPEEFEPAELHLKTNVRTLHPMLEDVVPKLRIHYDVWPEDVLRQFYSKQHCLLAPSRGEGKNVPALEFQSTGGVVIATNWGGHRQWLHPSYAYPLDYTLHQVDQDHINTLNARASVEHMKSQMLHVFRNRGEARTKGDLAAQTIPKIAAWDVVVTRLLARLYESTPGGKELWATASRTIAKEYSK